MDRNTYQNETATEGFARRGYLTFYVKLLLFAQAKAFAYMTVQEMAKSVEQKQLVRCVPCISIKSLEAFGQPRAGWCLLKPPKGPPASGLRFVCGGNIFGCTETEVSYNIQKEGCKSSKKIPTYHPKASRKPKNREFLSSWAKV